MNLIIATSYQEMSRLASEIVMTQIKKNPYSVLGLATGSTPLGLYSQLVLEYQKGNLSFSKIKTVNLDEYWGLGKDDEESYYSYMEKNLFSHVDIVRENIFIPDGRANDALKECKKYQEILKTLGKINLQILGIGRNGHIGFNEPGTEVRLHSHLVELKESTKLANEKYFEKEKEFPKYAITMGIEEILSAKKILLLADQEKYQIVMDALYGEKTPFLPASYLQQHDNLNVILVK